jgi:hypothetical protein
VNRQRHALHTKQDKLGDENERKRHEQTAHLAIEVNDRSRSPLSCLRSLSIINPA